MSELKQEFEQFGEKIRAELDKKLTSSAEVIVASAVDKAKLAFEEISKKGASAEELSAFKKETSDSLEALSKIVTDFKISTAPKDPIAHALDKFLEKKDSIKAALSEGRQVGFDINAAAGTITTSNLTSTATPFDGRKFEIDVEMSRLARIQPLYKKILIERPTSSPIIHYWDEVAGEGAATFIAENTEKQKKDYDGVFQSSLAKKVAKLVPASEELIADAAEFYNEIKKLVTIDLETVIDNAIFYGAGGNSLTGLTTIAGISFPAAAGFENTVTTPQTANAIICAIGAVANRGEGSKFMPTSVALNYVDYYNMFNQANGVGYTNNPLVQIIGANVYVAGMLVVPSNRITQGNLLVLDPMSINLRPLTDIRIDYGYATGDFEYNRITLRAEKRMHLYVKNNDKDGILYDSLADITDIIEKVDA